MLMLIATSGLAVWMLLALVTGLTIGAMARLRDECGVPGTAARTATAEVVETTVSASR